MKARRTRGDGHIFKRGQTFYFQARINGAVKTRCLHTGNRQEAERKAAELIQPILDARTKEEVALYVSQARSLAKAGKVKVSEAWVKFLRTKPNVSAGTLGNHARNWKRFYIWLQKERPQIVSLGQIAPETAREYMTSFANTGVHSDTFNKEKLTLAKVWDALADESGLKRTDNPFREIESRKDESYSRENLSEAELMKVLKTLDAPPFHLLNAPEIRVMFTLGAFTGMRLADTALLKWRDVMLDRDIIAFVPRKTARGTRRLVKIPIHPEVEAQLKLALEWKTDDYVLPKTAERYQRNPTGIKNDVIKVFEKCDFTTSETIEGRLRPCSRYGFHSLRHTFVSICANRGVPLAIVQELVGHGSPAITRHYFHGDEKTYREAIAALPSPTSLLASEEAERASLVKELSESLPKLNLEVLKDIAKLARLETPKVIPAIKRHRQTPKPT